MARPTIYTEELAEAICKRIAEGDSMRKIAKDQSMPSASTVFRWLLDEGKKPFWEQYEKACNIRAELKFEELEEIADNSEGEVQRDRLRIDTKKWYLSKVLPKKFGDKMDFTTGGEKIEGVTYEIIHSETALKKQSSIGAEPSEQKEDNS